MFLRQLRYKLWDKLQCPQSLSKSINTQMGSNQSNLEYYFQGHDSLRTAVSPPPSSMSPLTLTLHAQWPV